MLILLGWWVCIFLESLMLLRAFVAQTIGKYPFFYMYVASVLVTDTAKYVVYYHVGPSLYSPCYWATEFICLLVGCGIIFEVLEKGLAPYKGARRFARLAVLVLLGLVFFLAIALSLTKPAWFTLETTIDLERDLRIIQALVLATFLGVIFHYGIAVGKNMKGIIIGYGLYITTVIVNQGVSSYAGPAFTTFYRVIQPSSYLISLLIWTVALWSYHPNPAPNPSMELEADYEAAAQKTKNMVRAMRSYMATVAHS